MAIRPYRGWRVGPRADGMRRYAGGWPSAPTADGMRRYRWRLLCSTGSFSLSAQYSIPPIISLT